MMDSTLAALERSLQSGQKLLESVGNGRIPSALTFQAFQFDCGERHVGGYDSGVLRVQEQRPWLCATSDGSFAIQFLVFRLLHIEPRNGLSV